MWDFGSSKVFQGIEVQANSVTLCGILIDEFAHIIYLILLYLVFF